MHEFRRWIETSMERADIDAATLSRRSGISKQTLSNHLNDDRDRLDRMPTPATIDGLRRAFGVTREEVLVKIGEAMGLPMTPVRIEVESLSTDRLLDEVRRRIEHPQLRSVDDNRFSRDDDPATMPLEQLEHESAARKRGKNVPPSRRQATIEAQDASEGSQDVDE